MVMIRLLRFKYSFSHKSQSHMIQKQKTTKKTSLPPGDDRVLSKALIVLMNATRPPPQGPREKGRQLTSLSCLKEATDL